mmetsp:Transcript_72691/g.113741  ORF Transcript_72691/g.113741 Transcript_72691/m.113741 type:complete len:453 (+) Transcript_72691:92-1450(+)
MSKALSQPIKCNYGALPPSILEQQHSPCSFDGSYLRYLASALKILGPGMMVCLADSDIGGLLTMAQAGSATGYKLLPLQLLLVPVLYAVQEMVVRLSVCLQMGLVAAAWKEMGRTPAAVLSVVMVVLGIFALMSEFTGIAAVGQLFGMSSLQSCASAAAFLILIVLTGDYNQVERIGLALGSCLCVFVFTAILCRPKWEEVTHSFFQPNLQEAAPSAQLGELVLANIGTVVTPWMLFYQSSACVEKKLSVGSLTMARLDTLLGSIVTQLVMGAVLITYAVQACNLDLNKLVMGEVFVAPLRPLLGDLCTRYLLSCGLIGSSLLATLVISLGVAWNLSECYTDGTSAISGKATGSAAFRMFFAGTILLSAVVVSSEWIGIMRLNILVQLLNGTLMPVVVGYVFVLVTKPGVLPEEHRLKGAPAYFVFCLVLVCSVLALWLAARTASAYFLASL